MNRKVAGFLAAAVVVVLLIFFAPALHGVIYGLFVMNLPLAILGILVVLSFVGTSLGNALSLVAGISFALILSLLAAATPMLVSARLYEDLEATRIDEPRQTEALRYMPYRVAEARGLNASNDSLVELGEFEPLTLDGELSWVAPRQPNGLVGTFRRNTDGLLAVLPEGDTRMIGDEFTYGEGHRLWRNWKWQSHNVDYFSQKTNPYYVETRKGDVLLISPKVTYSFDFPVMMPKYDGVVVVHPDGNIESLSAQQAVEDPRFEGQRLYPKTLATRYMDSFAYRNGIWNALFVHREQTELPRLDEDNPQPYLLPSENGLSWVGVASPYGRSYSANTIFYVDARTGGFSFAPTNPDDDLLGAERSVDVLRSNYPNYGWGDTVRAVEPRPVVRNGGLYWMISITNNQFSSISTTAFINAADNNALVEVDGPENAQGFLEGGFEGGEPQNEEEAPETRSIGVIVREIEDLLEELEGVS